MKKRLAKKIVKNPARYHPHQIEKAEGRLAKVPRKKRGGRAR